MRYRLELALALAAATVAVAASAAVHATVPAHTASVVARPERAADRPASPPLATAAAFFVRELREKTDGDWNAAWRTLYPLHQRVAPQVELVRCERARRFPAPLEGLRVVGVHRALVPVPGLARRVPGVAVDVRVELRWYGPRDPIVFRHTFHLVPVRGRWTWLLSAPRYRLYRDDACQPGLAL